MVRWPHPSQTSPFTLFPDAQHCITRIDLPQTTATKYSHQAAAVRSYKIPTPKQAVATKVAQTLSEHGINSSRLVMPTRENLVHLESLIDATTLLLETKKNVERVEQEIRVTKAEIIKKKEQVGGGEGGETPMDVDQETGADDDDMDIHPGRGARKKNVGVSAHKDRKVLTQADSSFYRRGGPCRYLPLILQLNPDGLIKGKNRVELL